MFFYLKYLLLDNENSGQRVWRIFTVPILRKIEITIDFNVPKANFHHSITQKYDSEFIHMIIVENLHYDLFHWETFL